MRLVLSGHQVHFDIRRDVWFTARSMDVCRAFIGGSRCVVRPLFAILVLIICMIVPFSMGSHATSFIHAHRTSKSYLALPPLFVLNARQEAENVLRTDSSTHSTTLCCFFNTDIGASPQIGGSVSMILKPGSSGLWTFPDTWLFSQCLFYLLQP